MVTKQARRPEQQKGPLTPPCYARVGNARRKMFKGKSKGWLGTALLSSATIRKNLLRKASSLEKYSPVCASQIKLIALTLPLRIELRRWNA